MDTRTSWLLFLDAVAPVAGPLLLLPVPKLLFDIADAILNVC